MKKITQMILQRIRLYKQKIKNHRVLLIAKYKQHQGDKNDNTIEDNSSVCMCADSDNNASDIGNLNGVKIKESYPHDLNNPYEKRLRKIYDWVAGTKPTHFLTIHFPPSMRSCDLETATYHLKHFMQQFERNIAGTHWKKKHVQFISFAEFGEKNCYTYHFHILIHTKKYDITAIQTALDKTCDDLSLDRSICYLEDIYHCGSDYYGVIYYCLKSINPFSKKDWRARIQPSNLLFDVNWGEYNTVA